MGGARRGLLAPESQPPSGVQGAGQGITPAQPSPDGPGPHMSNYPEGAYEALITLPDEAVLAMSENEPPVEVD